MWQISTLLATFSNEMEHRKHKHTIRRFKSVIHIVENPHIKRNNNAGVVLVCDLISVFSHDEKKWPHWTDDLVKITWNCETDRNEFGYSICSYWALKIWFRYIIKGCLTSNTIVYKQTNIAIKTNTNASSWNLSSFSQRKHVVHIATLNQMHKYSMYT